MENKRNRISTISVLHYLKLIFRFALFLITLYIYILKRISGYETNITFSTNKSLILLAIWIIFVVEMVFRFFPSKLESMGCQKQFARNYKPVGKAGFLEQKSPLIVAVVWILLNTVIGILYYTSIIDQGMLLIISLAFAVCDMICILFFCPFQTWLMKNRCCVRCRIYNWDYLMMFTPLIFIKSIYTWSILAFALALFIRWEITYHKYPERFSAETNESLSCSNCNEKLCKHKSQLQHFLKSEKHFF